MIICAAIEVEIEFENEPVIICGYRHNDCYETFYKLNPQLSKQARRGMRSLRDGFLATGNRFLDRYEAYDEAIKCGQLSAANREYKADRYENMLYSEDLY